MPIWSAFTTNFTPKFVKKYADIGNELYKAFAEYCNDVRNGSFPQAIYTPIRSRTKRRKNS